MDIRILSAGHVHIECWTSAGLVLDKTQVLLHDLSQPAYGELCVVLLASSVELLLKNLSEL